MRAPPIYRTVERPDAGAGLIEIRGGLMQSYEVSRAVTRVAKRGDCEPHEELPTVPGMIADISLPGASREN